MSRQIFAVSVVVIINVFAFTGNSQCVHDHFAHKVRKHYYNDLEQNRILQQAVNGRIRIFADYNNVTLGGTTELNSIKRIVNITANYFYNTLNVTRLQRLYFPKSNYTFCGELKVPNIYIDKGTIGDLGILVGNVLISDTSSGSYVAKAAACAYLQSNKRPIWGAIIFNSLGFKFDQISFQQTLLVGIHEMTHILGFSAVLFQTYPNGNPLLTVPLTDSPTNGPQKAYYLNSEALQREIRNHFGCSTSKGLLLQDQDGTLIGSHWQRKILGNQFITASTRVAAYVSRFSLALLQSTGWYTSVNYSYAETTTWGKKKGCNFLNILDCDSDEFCTGNNFDCEWNGNSIGQCKFDIFAGNCKSVQYYTTTICIDENFQFKNPNTILKAMERGGHSSKCFTSDFKDPKVPQNSIIKNRCYISVCSASGQYIYILVGQAVLVCRFPGQRISAPFGLIGTLTCPADFNNYCRNKPNCPYHCNKNGACINGQCLCVGSTQFTPSCLDISIYETTISSTGGLLKSLVDGTDTIVLESNGNLQTIKNNVKPVIVKYSINKKCMAGTVFDDIFGECLQCKQVFNCNNCDQSGCFKCDDGKAPIGSICQ